MSTSQNLAYWSTFAQVIPAVTIALLIEVRVLTPRISEDLPRWIRWWMGVWLGGTLAGLGVSMFVAVQVLRESGDSGGGNLARWICGVSVTNSFAYVVADAVLPLFARAFAEFVAWGLTLHPVVRIQIWHLQRQTANLRRETMAVTHQKWNYIRLNQLQIRRLEDAVNRLELESPRPLTRSVAGSVEEDRENIVRWRREVKDGLASVEADIVRHSDRAETSSQRQLLLGVRAKRAYEAERSRLLATRTHALGAAGR